MLSLFPSRWRFRRGCSWGHKMMECRPLGVRLVQGLQQSVSQSALQFSQCAPPSTVLVSGVLLLKNFLGAKERVAALQQLSQHNCSHLLFDTCRMDEELKRDHEDQQHQSMDQGGLLGVNIGGTGTQVWRSFEDARAFVRSFKMPDQKAWRGWSKSGKCVSPCNPPPVGSVCFSLGDMFFDSSDPLPLSSLPHVLTRHAKSLALQPTTGHTFTSRQRVL